MDAVVDDAVKEGVLDKYVYLNVRGPGTQTMEG